MNIQGFNFGRGMFILFGSQSENIYPDENPQRTRYVLENGKVVYLKRGDRDIFQLLHHFTFLANYQVIYFLKYLYGESPETVRKRYRRFRDKGILLSKPYSRGWGSPYKIYFYLSQKGFNLLKETQLVPEDDEYKSNFRRIGGMGTKDHFFAIRDAILLSLIEAGRIETDENETSFRKNLVLINPNKLTEPMIVPKDQFSHEKIVPDWIIKIPAPATNPDLSNYLTTAKDEYLYYEIDNSNQKSEAIQRKVKKYIQWARLRANEKHRVLFPVIDRSLPDLKYDIDIADKRIRVGNLKNYILEICLKTRPFPENLAFYVFSIGRTGKIARNLMYEEYQNKRRMRNQLLSAIKMVQTNNPHYKFHFKEIDPNAVYRADVRKEEHGELILEFSIHGYKRIVIFKLMEEGNVHDYDILEYHNVMMGDDSFRVKVDDIIAVYQTKEELMSDVLEHNWRHVLFTDIESIKAGAKSDNIRLLRYRDNVSSYEDRFEEVTIL